MQEKQIIPNNSTTKGNRDKRLHYISMPGNIRQTCFMYTVFICQEASGVKVMCALHPNRHKPTVVVVGVVVYASFASSYPYVYGRIQCEGLS